MLKNDMQYASPWRQWLLRTISSVLSAMFVANSYAAEMLALSTEDAFLGDIPVVLSATRLVQPRSEAPAAVSIIDREMIEASGATEITDLFRLVPGFQIGHDNASLFSTDPVAVTYHGLSDSYARRLQVLIDGRSIYSPDFGGVRWNELPLDLDDIERIEVIRGPNGSTFGANSFLAVINIITRHPADVVGTSVKAVVGGNNIVKGVVRHAASSNKYDYRLTLAYRSDSGFENQYDDEEISFASYRSEFRFDNNNSIEFNFGLGGGTQQAGNIGNIDQDKARIVGSDSNYQQIKWRRKSGVDGEHQLQYYRNFSRYRDQFTAFIFSQPDIPIDQGVVTERNNIEYQYIRTWNEKLRSVWGAEVRQDTSRADDGWFWQLGQVTNNIRRVFANAEWRTSSKLLINAGLMVENTDFTGTGISPSAALNYKLARGHTLRAKVSQGLRTPSLMESRGNAYINLTVPGPTLLYDADPDNSPEKITSYEIGYFFESGKRTVEADVRLFRDEITNMISYPDYSPQPPSARFMNGGYSTITGVELDLNYKPNNKTRVVVAYSLTDQQGMFIASYDATTIPPETYVSTAGATPLQTASLLGIYKLNAKTTASIGYYHVGDMGWFDSLTTIPGYSKIDMRIARKVKIGDSRGTVELVGQNLGDTYYTYDPGSSFERRIFVKLRLQK
ncbi:MAG: TonB-dependent receptor plug domain-containing protein [Acidiferrobacterales bacterium]